MNEKIITKNQKHKLKNGILLINKPKGITSFKAVSIIKRKLSPDKIGHCGTLDPLANGLLILCINKATKIARFFEALDKEYITTMKLGETTTTYDEEGEVTSKNPVNTDKKFFKKVINRFKGKIEQLPPVYSALKINGQPAYKYARQGKKLEMKKRVVNIKQIELINFDLPYAEIKCECSKGTYIRSLVNDIGAELGCGAYVTELTRTKIGNFDLNNSIDINEDSDEIANSIIDINNCLAFLPFIRIYNEYALKILNGVKLRMDFLKEKFVPGNSFYRIIDEDDNTIAVVSYSEETGFKYEKVFAK